MWPQRLPREIQENPFRKAERDVYAKLASELDEKWIVFYSRPWLGLNQSGEEVDGEADFIVAHPDRGLLAIEVKGGGIDWDPMLDRWTSTGARGWVSVIKDPVAQARSAKHQIVKKLKESPHWKARWFRIRHGVIFPNCSVPNKALGPDRPRKLFCDTDEFKHSLGSWIEQRFAVPDPEDPSSTGGGLDVDGVRALEKLLADPIRLHGKLSSFAADDDRALGLLTQQQFHILELMEDHNRQAIRGAAGTGKTVLAMESARRRANAGDRVVLLCYNNGLANKLRRELEGSNIQSYSFHQLCRTAIELAGLEIPECDEGSLYYSVLPELLDTALGRLPSFRFEAVIVDEAQDFRPHWWPAIDSLLTDPATGRLQVFYDSNQRVYHDLSAIPVDTQSAPFRLTLNLRNTREIHRLAIRFYDGIDVRANDITGANPEFVEVTNPGSLPMVVERTVRHLVEVEGFARDDIAVLAANRQIVLGIVPNGSIAGYPVKSCVEYREDAVTVDTIRRFKGLESIVVVLLVTSELFSRDELPYVALSRPRSYVVCVGEGRLLDLLRDR